MFIVAASFLCVASTATAESRRFHGQIVDTKTGKALSNVRIRVFNQIDVIVAALRVHPALPNSHTPSIRKPKAYVQPAATTRSDTRGRFVIEARGSGVAELVCDRPGTSGGMSFSNVQPNKFLEIRYNPIARPVAQ